MDLINRLQKWYQAHCNGEWEHLYGIRIDNIDNPGWSVHVDLIDTELEDRPFSLLFENRSEQNWISCEIKEGCFIGVGGPNNLSEILEIFLKHAQPE